ncbi:transmembrane protein 53-A [Lampris incognitus]|uniref:transmembrane protein 53-A n=1 Tax=Lampris incognitus TaxID=2546036 RepID=UPI0024B5F033|nr:transmembrane protein 53-A [Lampris incognitus]
MLTRATISSAVTAHRLSKNVTFYLNESVSPASRNQTSGLADSKPLLLMLPWLGARPQALAKYCEIYVRAGYDILMVESEVKDFLWPRWGLENGAQLLELLHSERFASRPLLVHAFSVGGYTFAQLLVNVSRDVRRYQGLTQRIRGHVYDSLVVGSLEKMAIGLGKTVFPRLERVVKQVSLLYFFIFKQQTVDYFDTSVDVFRNNPITAPALFFFCENDPMSDPRAMEEIIGYWQQRGVAVTAKKWEDSTHAGHMRRYPQEYVDTLDAFLRSLSTAPLRSKM